MLEQTVEKALNDQVQAELYSSYLYLSMAAYFEEADLPGFAHWMRVQSQEEWGHGLRIYDYVVERGGRVTLQAIQQPPADYDSPLGVFEQVYAHEQKVTSLIHELYGLAAEHNDYATQSMLQWFVDEQVEEESSANQVLERLKMAGDQGHALLVMDRAMAARE
jgi:ferritin